MEDQNTSKTPSVSVGFFEYGPGMKSMGRLLAFMLTFAGVWMIAVGSTMAVVDFFLNEAASLGQWTAMAGMGLVAEGIGGLMKNWAKNVEAHSPSAGETSGQSESQ